MIDWPFSRPKKEARVAEKQAADRGYQEAVRALEERKTRLEALVEKMKEERQAKP